MNIARRMRIAGCITQVRDTHSEYVIIIVFHGNNGYANTPHCYLYKYNARRVSSN